MKKTAFIILGILITAQLLIPASMILKHERVLRIGELYRFKTRPIDPSDPLQGRYIQLGFENDYIPVITGTNTVAPKCGERVYVTLAADTDSFCKLTGWSRKKPETNDYLKLKYSGYRNHWGRKTMICTTLGLGFELPFDHFYMNENKAPQAEQLTRRRRLGLQHGTENTNQYTNCWVNVRILNGTALIEDVLVDGTPIRELAAQPAK